MLYNNLKEFIKKFPIIWKFLRRSKDSLIELSRWKDVITMMIVLHLWPEQTYRFSTRRHLPSKKNRFSRESRPIIPYELLKSKSSNIPIMKEINVVGIGSSFNLNNLKDLKGPIFHVPSYGPLRIDNNGKIFRKHFYLFESGKFIELKDHFSDQAGKEYKKNNLTYVISRKNIIEKFKKNGNNVLCVHTYATDKNGNHYPLDEENETPSFLNLFDGDHCKRISVAEKVYRPPLLPPHPNWAPTKSFLPNLCALSFFAEKINVYGWDFYLDSSPENMSYWPLFFNMYKYKEDLNQSMDHFESALINFYYGYHLSKLPNIKIHGYMGKLGKHYKLIQRIEKVLFN